MKQLTGVPEASVMPYMCSTSNPNSLTDFNTVAGGGEPAVRTRTARGNGLRSLAGASASAANTIGAAQKWSTPCSRMALNIPGALTLRRQTWVPPAAVTAQVKHHPLAWNIGSVQRYTGARGTPQSINCSILIR